MLGFSGVSAKRRRQAEKHILNLGIAGNREIFYNLTRRLNVRKESDDAQNTEIPIPG
jgi:hypothetical protein